MHDLIPSQCCDLKYHCASQELLENCCVFLKLSVVFRHPLCALSSLNTPSEAQITYLLAAMRMSYLLLLTHSCAGSLKAVYKGDKARSCVVVAVTAVSLNIFFILQQYSTRVRVCVQ